jgi:hypothetical protein
MTRRSSPSVVAGLLIGAAAMAAPSTSHAQAGGEPVWPQSFQIPQGETRGFAFVVTQPGPITVSIRAQGAPVAATLSGPVAGSLQQAGSGAFTISHTATAAEVQKGSLWIVTLAASSGPPALKVVPQIVAQGAITIQHPAGDATVARAELQRKVVAVRPMATPVVALVSAKQTAYLSQIAAQQAAKKQTLLAQITARAPVAAVRPAAPKLTAPSVRTAGGSDGGQPSGGSSTSAPPPPHIASLNVSRGQPGDPVLITGSGFGNVKGQVHFMVGSGPPVKDDTASQVDYWSDTQILAHVPPESGIQGYNGQAYVKNANGSSQLVLFQFVPQLQFVSIDLNIESTITDGGGQHSVSTPGNCRLLGINGPVDPGTCVDHSVTADPGSAFTWHSNDDQFFPYLKLLGGWTTESVELRTDSGPGGGAYLADKREGTSSPFARVHWWVNPMGEMKYSLAITIKGPAGVPYR